jgi:molybdenum cofactor cytidylyltransferase
MTRLAAIVTAAGFGRRYGPGGKLHAALDGRPVLAWTLDILAELPLVARVVVHAPGDLAAQALARAGGARAIANPDPATGLGRSIACGVLALPSDIDGVLIMLGDMPRVRVASVQALLQRFAALDAAAVVLPVHAGRRGHPVLFGAAHLPALAALSGDRGARDIVQHAVVTTVDVDDPGVLLDIDTPSDLAAAARGDTEAN